MFNPYQFNPYAVQYQQQNQIQQQPQMQIQNQPQIQQPTNNGGIIWVSGLEEANNFIVAPNNAVPLWDRNGKAIYLKSADATGLCNIKIMDISERKAVENVFDSNKEFVLVDDFNAFRGEFDDLKSIVDGLIAKKTKKEVKNDE